MDITRPDGRRADDSIRGLSKELTKRPKCCLQIKGLGLARALLGVLAMRFLRGLAIVTCVGFFNDPAWASSWDMVINGKAYHINAEESWNEDNWGLGLEREFGEATSRWVPFAVANGFKDSMDGMSYMGGGGLKRRFALTRLHPELYLDLGVVGFVMRREDVRDGRPFLGALPAVTIGGRRAALNITYLPSSAVDTMTDAEEVDPSMTGILFFQLKLSLGYLLPAAR